LKCDRSARSGVTPHPSAASRVEERDGPAVALPPAPRIDDSRTSPLAPVRPDAATAQAIVEHFPFGILELDADGCARTWNPAAGALLGDRLQPGTACCDLFDCRSGDDGALGGRCLTELEPPDGRTTPEIRVDLPGDDDVAGALWLTVAPLERPGGGRIVQLRPGDRRDRRRRTDPHWVTGGPRLRIRALGRTEVLADETALGGRWLAQRPGQMLKFLVSQRTRAVLLDEVAYALWPESGYDAQGNVRHTMHRLRRRLEPARSNRAESTFIVTREGTYRLASDHVSVDADEFEALVGAGLPALETDPPRGRALLEKALDLYRGDFLADEPYAEWALDERSRLRDIAARVLHTLARLDEEADDLEAAYLHLRRLAELEPLDVHVQRDLLAVCLRRGRRTEARRRYDALWRRSMRELGHEPGFRLEDLADEVGGAGAAGPATSADRTEDPA
jgi:DNA-binding SARP family transcriptional activator